MGRRLSKFESSLDKALDNAAGAVFHSPISPVQLTKRAEKEMHREKLVSAGVQHAPTLYNVLVNPADDAKLAGFYPTLAGEMETYLKGKAGESGLRMDGNPLVRFIVDDKLRSGKFDVIAENVSASIIAQLRVEEMERYGISPYEQPYTQQPQQQTEPSPTADDDDIDAYFAAAGDSGRSIPILAAPGSAEPAASSQDFVTIINTATGDAFDITAMRASIGRDQNNDIVIRDRNISRSHAELVQQGNAWFVNDLGSTNGTYLNEAEVSHSELHDGDILTLGTTNLEFRKG